jgi:hypothetical protein
VCEREREPVLPKPGQQTDVAEDKDHAAGLEGEINTLTHEG